MLPRKVQISLADTPFYHCIARCVRRAFLCGNDRYTGKSFDHRRQWLVNRIRLQAKIFNIDVCAYAIMGNHYHLVLRVDKKGALGISDREVAERWTRIFRGPLLIQQFLNGAALNDVEQRTVSDIVAIWRHRLFDISWFMRCLNEYIARRANAEDDCSGRFWEGRFKSRALLDGPALLSCMAYVDLNPVRAGTAESLSESDFTSVQERLKAAQCSAGLRKESDSNTFLAPFKEPDSLRPARTAIHFDFRSYLNLLEQTCNLSPVNVQNHASFECRQSLCELGLSLSQWRAMALEVHSLSLQAIGDLEKLHAYSQSTGRKWVAGSRRFKVIYGSA